MQFCSFRNLFRREQDTCFIPRLFCEITRAILSGEERGAKREIVLLNAGAALYIGGKAESIADGIILAKEAIDSGKAAEVLENLVNYTK